MNNFNCINIINRDDKEQKPNYIPVNHIAGVVSCEDCTRVFINNRGMVYIDTNATADEVLKAIVQVAEVSQPIPSVGFTQREEPNPNVSKILKMVNEYNNREFGRYCDYGDALNYFNTIIAKTKDGNEYKIANINEGHIVTLADEEIEFSQLTDESIEKCLKLIQEQYKWDTIYEWIGTTDSNQAVVNIWNELHENCILDNNEENLNKFNLSAGALMKSMVNGKYKKNDEYITISNGELISCNQEDFWRFVDTCEIADWLAEHKDLAKQYLPIEIYNNAFKNQ